MKERAFEANRLISVVAPVYEFTLLQAAAAIRKGDPAQYMIGADGARSVVRHALGDVPLVGFFAAGEIAHHHLYGYTGVLTVFRGDAA